jgi:hypothetical protein
MISGYGNALRRLEKKVEYRRNLVVTLDFIVLGRVVGDFVYKVVFLL